MAKGRTLLLWAGWAMVGLVIFHLVVMVIGEAAYEFGGAGEDMVRMAREGSWVPALVTLLVAAILAVWALYAFSGAGVLRHLPGLTPVLYVIAAILLLRAAAGFVYDLGGFSGGQILVRELIYSLCALILGLLYLVGARSTRR